MDCEEREEGSGVTGERCEAEGQSENPESGHGAQTHRSAAAAENESSKSHSSQEEF